MSGSLLVVEALTHRYGERTALDNVSFQVGKGEIFGLLGPNGGGKTTLFRILCTLMQPTGGRALMDGGPIDRHRIGVVFQSPGLDKKLTVLENLRHQGHLYGLSGSSLAARMMELLRRFGVSDRANELVEKLSGGLRRRVELAKGLLHRPELLLLDEPSTGLDPLARRELSDYLETLRKNDGVTVVLTTHLMEEADRCDRLALLDRGRLVALDRPGALKEQVGGDVISISAGEPEQLREKIQKRFGVQPTVVDHTLRIERPRAHEFIPDLVEAFPGAIDSVSVGKPTLEDVFIHLTGHRLGVDEP
ncbi:MAG TPA: ATP-binding cassette domain-containing protein [Verrucomicrobiae bacterium]|nr:ATP-binding cassette domain-containing protein [Verrucomicrobiae bacterium]